MIWRSARAWRYVAHDALDGIVLPKPRKARRLFFTIEETQRILATAGDRTRRSIGSLPRQGCERVNFAAFVWMIWT
jgi:hypothetical protein